VSTRPSDYKPPPDSPHMGITLPQHLIVTPSGVLQNKPKFVVVSRLPNLYQKPLKRAIIRNLVVRAITRTLHWTS